MSFIFEECSEYVYCAKGSGTFYAKLGSMIADKGQFTYSKCLIGPMKGANKSPTGMVGAFVNHVVRKAAGENLQLMSIEGNGEVYLADNGLRVTALDLTNDSDGNTCYVESDNVLAFTLDCKYGVELIPSGVAVGDMLKTKFTCVGRSAQILITSVGIPLILESPCRVDPDALLAWTGPKPVVNSNIGDAFNVFKTLIGQSSGESYVYEFRQPGQIVLVQPVERRSKIGISVDGSTGNQHNYNTYNR